MTLGEIKQFKFTIYAHYSATGATEALRDWLIKNKAGELVYLAFPFGDTKDRFIRIDIYKNGIPANQKKSIIRFNRPEVLSYLKDFIYGLIYGIRFCKNSDFFFGGDNLLSTIGICLKFLRCVKKTVYYMIDYTPLRYKNTLLNSLYYSFDRIASYKCDMVWALNENMINGRHRDGKLDKEKVNWLEIPFGNHSTESNFKIVNNKNWIVYMGEIVQNKGAELFIPIAEKLISKNIKFKFVIIGGGCFLEEIKKEIEKKGIQDYFKIYGYIEDFKEVNKILLECGIGIAPYYPYDKNSFTYYADPGKIKSYLGSGLPVVLTDVPPIAGLIQKNMAGLRAGYSDEDFALKIIRILDNYDEYRKKAFEMGLLFNWGTIFTNAFEKL